MRRRPEHLTEREEEILGHIRRAIVDRGEALSVRELGAALGLSSTSTVVYHLQNLEQRGALTRDGLGWRTCRLTQ
ncbi:helix-turn-helix domain-containing protein [Streptomyces sp. NPDC002265]|uniref:LexA family protein n=1 Tax=Streptomyces sp. NPDC002265 TaxID=3154415 RepID=UPI0033173EFF